jgi:hypothetical protein
VEVLNAKAEENPILVENPPAFHRETHMFVRGNWLVPGKEVQPDVPATLNPFPKDAPRN